MKRDVHEYRRERIRQLESENRALLAHRERLERLIGYLCPDMAVLAELERIVDAIEAAA